MRKRFALAAASALVAVMGVSATANAKNENPVPLTNFSCEDGSFVNATVVLPALTSPAGRVNGSHGVAKSALLYFNASDAESNTNVVDVLFDVPGLGHDKQTVWCWWITPFEVAPGVPLWGGGQILFNGPR